MEIKADITYKNGKKESYEATSDFKKAWCVYEYRDSCGTGTERLFDTKEEALATAKDEWHHLAESDKDSYIHDVAGQFWVGLVWIHYDEDYEEWVRADGTYEYYCNPIEIVKDFVEEEKAVRAAAEEEGYDE